VKEKKYWQINTDKLVEGIEKVARQAETEEDLKMGMKKHLQVLEEGLMRSMVILQ